MRIGKRLDKMIMAAYNMGEGSLATAGGKGSTAGSVDLAFITFTEPEVPMKQIKLTQGKVVLVDDADYDWLSQWKWHADKSRYTFYAERMAPGIVYRQIKIKMHRLILGLKHGDRRHCDHRDHDGLNNQRSNLRICTNQQNHFNRRCHRGSSSKFKGVSWYGQGKWYARICYQYKHFYLGYFDSEIEAARVYDKKAKKLFGEFARLNFP